MYNNDILVAVWVGPDGKDSDAFIVKVIIYLLIYLFWTPQLTLLHIILKLCKKKITFQFDQSDLLLPSSDYYKLGFAHPVMQTYYNMVVDVATVLGADPARAKREVRKLVDFETELAEIMIPPVMRRNFSEIYKKMPLEELQVANPQNSAQHSFSHINFKKLEISAYNLDFF